jgi:alpha-methylacyl-CoA racemase
MVCAQWMNAMKRERDADNTRSQVADATPLRGPLRGLRVLEFAGLGPVPYAAMLLSDMGADVVRLDRPGGQRRAKDIISRGRLSFELDLKQAKDLDCAVALAKRADVLLEGFRPGVMERLGLGPEQMLAENPKLVYGRMTGWGQTGPLAATAGHDINYIALSGALNAIGPADGPPVPPLNLLGDYGGGSLFLVMGILAAVLDARQSGRGQVVDCAICDGVVSMLSLFHTLSALGQWSDQRGTNSLDGGAHYYTTYECADGRYIAVGAGEPKFYATFRELAGLTDPEFDKQRDRTAWPGLKRKAQAVFKTKTRGEWIAIFEGNDACVVPVLSLSEAMQHPHLQARASAVEIDGLQQTAPAPRFSRTPSSVQPTRSVSSIEELRDYWSA